MMREENEEKEELKFLTATYKACLIEGLNETPEQFLMRMTSSEKVADKIRPTLNQLKKLYDEKNSK